MKDLELKSKVLKDLISFMRGQEKDSWKSVLEEGGEEKSDSEEESSDDSEEECDCGKKDCPICGKKPMTIVEETLIVGKPKK